MKGEGINRLKQPPFSFTLSFTMLRPFKTYGFSLLEILLVVALTAVLALLLVPVTFKMRQSAHKAGCVAHQRVLGAALFLYAGTHQQRLPFLEQEVSGGNRIAHPPWNAPLVLARELVGFDGSARYLDFSGPPGSRWADAMHCPGDPNKEHWKESLGYSRSYMYRQSDTASGSNGGGRVIRLGMDRNGPVERPRWLVLCRYGTAGSPPKLPFPGRFKDGSASSYWHEGGLNVLYEDGSVQWRSFPEDLIGI